MSKVLKDIGLHLIVGLEGPRLSEEEREILEELSPLGIILFAKNMPASDCWMDELRTLIDESKKAIGREFVFISVDHEGGRVQRFPDPVTSFPYATRWKGHWEAVGTAMGEELRSLGFNLNFAPVLDIHSEESNPVIGPRAFASSAEEVAEAACAFKKGLESQGILSCAKHFPGHGATTTDSHLELPILDESLETLSSRELASFKEYFSLDPALLMVAHVRYPALDAANPATLSPSIIRQLLRNEMQFSGAVISDDLEMSALAEISAADKARRFLGAGGDILLEGNPSEGPALLIAREMANGIRQAYHDGSLPESVLLESQKRIRSLIEEAQSIAEKGKQDLERAVVGCAEHLALAGSLSDSDT